MAEYKQEKTENKECPHLRYPIWRVAWPGEHEWWDIRKVIPPSDKIECELLNSIDKNFSSNFGEEYRTKFCCGNYSVCEFKTYKDGIQRAISEIGELKLKGKITPKIGIIELKS